MVDIEHTSEDSTQPSQTGENNSPEHLPEHPRKLHTIAATGEKQSVAPTGGRIVDLRKEQKEQMLAQPSHSAPHHKDQDTLPVRPFAKQKRGLMASLAILVIALLIGGILLKILHKNASATGLKNRIIDPSPIDQQHNHTEAQPIERKRKTVRKNMRKKVRAKR